VNKLIFDQYEHGEGIKAIDAMTGIQRSYLGYSIHSQLIRQLRQRYSSITETVESSEASPNQYTRCRYNSRVKSCDNSESTKRLRCIY
jgi:hypothetical protein